MNIKEEPVISLTKTVEEIEKRLITNALDSSNWVIARASRRLDITERMLAYKMKKYNMNKQKGKKITIL
ncbi:MAG: helix-turn-helix domain-containing protein [Nitrospirae bacterium]|nr:helix-turn-helix domain-containing protein [Nitrospirota bacterium]